VSANLISTDKQLAIQSQKVNSLKAVSSNEFISNTQLACSYLFSFRFATSNACMILDKLAYIVSDTTGLNELADLRERLFA